MKKSAHDSPFWPHFSSGLTNDPQDNIQEEGKIEGAFRRQHDNGSNSAC
jgi:hypothetical protein